MRKKTRDPLPNTKVFQHANTKSPISKRISNERVNLIENVPKDAREKALGALAMMKELEARYKDRMVKANPDDRTLLCSNKAGNLKMRLKSYKAV